MKHTYTIFVFRRSFRLDDNTGLIEALKNSELVVPLFIFTPEQVVKNSYKSDNAVQCMIESLEDLQQDLKKRGSRLFYFFGQQHTIIEKLIKTEGIDAVYVNTDYTPYARKRDTQIAAVCEKHQIAFHAYEDILLQPIGSIVNTSGSIYTKFTPYLKKAIVKPVAAPKKNRYKNYISAQEKIPGEYKKNLTTFYKTNKNAYITGGRKEALKILKQIDQYKDYDKKRNNLTYETTRLSAYIKYGAVSIRELYKALQKINSKALFTQLYWRDFYYNIVYSFPNVFSEPMKKQYKKIKWQNNNRYFTSWKKGKTGIPVVDACMRQLNKTGFMHNRGRLIVSNFLIKILLTDWRKGEKYFAQKLIDYDPAVNNGNWQWGASTGADSQPYFRVFNPWLQSKKYDPEAMFIKQWIPELKDVLARDIHNWHKTYKKYPKISKAYGKPIVDYAKQKKIALQMYKAIY